MPPQIDLSAIPIVDHHAHALTKAVQIASLVQYQGYFSESPDPIIKARYVPDSIMWLWAIRELAGYLDCEPTAEAVFAARNARPIQELANGMWTDQNSVVLMIDYGFRSAENYTPEELRATFNQRVEMILRLETFAQDLILQHSTFSRMLDAFVAGVEGARAAGHIALKSIIAYRTGLDIAWTSRDDAVRAFGQVKDQADREGHIRLASKPLCDFLVLTALDIANRQEMPIQFHTGFGDTDVDMLKANPLHMRPLLQSDRFRKVPFVLLHAAYPYIRELGYLAAMYPNVYMDLSLAIPFITTQIPTLIHEALGLTPLTKVLYSSDAFSIPEIFWLANRWGRAGLEQVLSEIVQAGALTEAQAQWAGEQILSANARRVYQLA
ncbi:MAG: amidohydrolase family protein [Anaerolineae bacterium]|nr:amidohydrolase family protein [Anaerolineae bacterium]